MKTNIKLPKTLGHNYTPLEVLPKSYLKKEEILNHRRLSVFRTKGFKCAVAGCTHEGVHVILAVDKGGGKHVDIYTKDFKMMTVDHIIPRSKGGTDGLENKQPMCQECNERKGNKYIAM